MIEHYLYFIISYFASVNNYAIDLLFFYFAPYPPHCKNVCECWEGIVDTRNLVLRHLVSHFPPFEALRNE